MVAPSAVMPSASMMAHGHVNKEMEPVLLIVGQRLIKRLGRIGKLSEIGRTLGHGVSASPDAGDGVLAFLFLRALSPLGHALLPRLSHVANGLLDGGPLFFLVRRELQPGLERGDTCIRPRLPMTVKLLTYLLMRILQIEPNS